MSPVQFVLLPVSVLANVVVLLSVVGLGTCSAPFGIKPTHRRYLAQHLSYVLIAVVLGLLATQGYVFFVLCRPTSQCAIVLYSVALLLAVSSYLRTALTNPGNPDSIEWQKWASTANVDGEGLESQKPAVTDQIREECVLGGNPWLSSGASLERLLPKRRQHKGWAPGEVTKCAQCDRQRPERSHHCWRCDTCVLRMDHHCSLIGNCVGWRNHKYFVLLQWYQFWACAAFLLTPGGPGERAWRGTISLDNYWTFFIIDMSVVWTLGLGIITGKTFVTTLFGVMSNTTCIESHYNCKNPYRMPKFYDNVREVFGELDWAFWLPVVPVGRRSGGTQYPVHASSAGSACDSPVYGAVR